MGLLLILIQDIFFICLNLKLNLKFTFHFSIFNSFEENKKSVKNYK